MLPLMEVGPIQGPTCIVLGGDMAGPLRSSQSSKTQITLTVVDVHEAFRERKTVHFAVGHPRVFSGKGDTWA